jgi:antitoxin component of MazEF toxin-antitoxin module
MQKGDQVRIFYNDLLYVKPLKKEELADKLERAKEILTEPKDKGS